MLERFLRRKKEVPQEPWPILLHTENEVRPLHANESVVVWETHDDCPTKISIHTAKTFTTISVNTIWEGNNYHSHRFDWGTVERYKEFHDSVTHRRSLKKVKEFGHTLADTVLAVDKNSGHILIKDTPLSFSADCKTLFLGDKILLEWKV